MSADKHQAEVLADDAPIGDTDRAHAWVESARAELRRLSASEAALIEALERIADPRNIHMAGDAQVVARAAIARAKEASNG